MTGKKVPKNLAIAFDIGNTNADIGVVDLEKFSCMEIKSLPSELFISKIPGILCQFQKIYGSMPVKGATVIRKESKKVEHAVKIAGWGSIDWVSVERKLPIKISYKTKHTLGQDRIANCIAASFLSGGHDAIVIDSGTAITVDLFRGRNGFCGGVILPGLAMQYRSLSSDTADLPQVNLSPKKVAVLGRSTRECIKSGVEWGVAGALSLVVEKLKHHCNSQVKIYATGGTWRQNCRYLNFKAKYVENMTLLGVALV